MLFFIIGLVISCCTFLFKKSNIGRQLLASISLLYFFILLLVFLITCINNSSASRVHAQATIMIESGIVFEYDAKEFSGFCDVVGRCNDQILKNIHRNTGIWLSGVFYNDRVANLELIVVPNRDFTYGK